MRAWQQMTNAEMFCIHLFDAFEDCEKNNSKLWAQNKDYFWPGETETKPYWSS